MLAGCIETMTARSCGTCAQRDDCSFVLPEALGFILSSLGRETTEVEPAVPGPNPFFAFLGEVARGIQRNRKRRETPLRRAVERHLEPLLSSGPIRIDEVARALGYSRQTLYRRLKAEGATFEEVLDDLRRRVALRLIRDEALPVKEAAWRLGFSDPAAFSRAFKRWTGASPSEQRGRKLH
ncbi:MAG: helix-turn-helix transcriptional regulator [Sphingosinicella sp.]|uniref:helix-turn-helix transcriptional regulator n=1 Tax=Sphingosinicella sp. TaxID=1917971 RepID=UPI0040378F85